MTQDAPNQSTAGSDVFVSYASGDAAVAKSIVGNLEQHGFKCWMAPRDVKPGAPYAAAIVQGISEANALVLVLSASSVQSDHVAREVERAASKHKPIYAFRIDAAPLNAELEYFLSKSQWIDVPALGMPAALAKLKEAVGKESPSSLPDDPWLRAELRPVGKRGVAAKRVAVAVAIVIGLGVAVGLGLRFWKSQPHAPVSGANAPAAVPITDKSIAVLPFTDMSEKHDQEYFGDGMAEEILDLLAKIPGLKVIGRTSSFQFKGKNEDLRTIGLKLNAAYVLEGSVRKSEDQVRITAQLINTKTGTHEWSETYDRQIGNVLKLQDAIAAAVARELQLTVAPGFLTSRPTVKDDDAYDLMLRGRHAADRWDKEGLDEAVTLFKQALDRDPTSADAAAELAWSYEVQGEEGYLTPVAAFEPARRAAAIALKLDPKNARAHFVVGLIQMFYGWDWAAAEQEFQQVAILAPGSKDALMGEAELSLALGRWDNALRQIKAALAQDPLDPTSFYELTEIQLRRGYLTEAEAAMRTGLEIRPTYVWGHWLLGLVLLARGDRDAALFEMQRVNAEDGRQSGLAIVYYALRKNPDSDASLARLLKEHALESAYLIANVYAFRGQSDEAMHWLERAYAQKDAGLIYAKVELPLRSLQGDARFKAFLRKMNLPE